MANDNQITGPLMASGYSKNGTQEAMNGMYVASAWDGSDVSSTLTARNAGGQRMPDKDNFTAVVEPVAMSDRKGNNGVSTDGTALTLTAQEKDRPIIATQEVKDAAARNKILRILQETYGAEKVSQWCSAIMERVQQTKILQQGVHESGIQSEAKERNELDDNTLPRPELVAEWLLRDLRKGEECGCTSCGWKSAEQSAGEFAEAMPELPHESAQASAILFNMWQKGEGIGLLQQALYPIQKIWESAMGKRTGGGDAMTSVVRRLTPLE